FFFQAEDGIRDRNVTGVQTCALPIWIFDEFARESLKTTDSICLKVSFGLMTVATLACVFAEFDGIVAGYFVVGGILLLAELVSEIGRASCRESGEFSVDGVA